jgi:hypothetical protein
MLLDVVHVSARLVIPNKLLPHVASNIIAFYCDIATPSRRRD